MKKIKIDDDFQSYLVEGATFVGEAGIPMLMDTSDIETPKDLISFRFCKNEKDRHKFVHFYIYDKYFSSLLVETKKHLEVLRTFDGVITPDPTIMIGGPRCLQETNVYFSRAIGFYLQKNGIPVIPNVRWGDPSTYSFCFLGIPRNSIVAISTLGAIRRDSRDKNTKRNYFKRGLEAMLETINPRIIVVYGNMPKDIFGNFETTYKFVRFSSQINWCD